MLVVSLASDLFAAFEPPLAVRVSQEGGRGVLYMTHIKVVLKKNFSKQMQVIISCRGGLHYIQRRLVAAQPLAPT